MPHITPKKTGRRIGIISYDYDPPIGGLGVLVQTYLVALKMRCPEDTYCVISPSANADDRGSALGRMRYRKSGGCPLFSLSLLLSLPRMLRKHRCELLHVHAGSGGVFLLRKPQCKLVVTAHHTYVQEAELVFMHSVFKKIWKRCMARLESRTYHMADSIVCVSRDTADALTHKYAVPAERICVIENPVPVIRTLVQPAVARSTDTILFVGRLEERKGIHLLLEACELLRKVMPTVKLRLVGTNLLGDQLETALRSRGLHDSTSVLGFLQDSLRFREMSEAKVLVVPSMLEGFGLVAAEAMVLGTCVVVSDAPGLRSIVTHDRTGMIFPVGNARACADALQRIMTDSALRNRLAAEAQTEARQRFDSDSRTKDLSDVYTRVLGT